MTGQILNYHQRTTQIVYELLVRECEGVKAADIVIVITPQGRGTHIELGMAIALGKKVYIYHIDDSYFKCNDNTCAFYWLPQVKQLTGKIETVIEVILRENTNPC